MKTKAAWSYRAAQRSEFSRTYGRCLALDRAQPANTALLVMA